MAGGGWHDRTMPREGYIAELRALVGTMPLLMPSVAVLVHHGDRIAIGRHRDTGRWVIPGGAVEPGERPATCAVREVAEETGLAVRLTGLRGVYGGGPAHRVHYPNGDVCDYVVTIFDADVDGSTELPTETEELTDLAWVDAAQLATLDTPPWLDAVVAHPMGFEPPD